MKHEVPELCASQFGTALNALEQQYCLLASLNQYHKLKFDGVCANNSKLGAVCTKGSLMTLLYQS